MSTFGYPVGPVGPVGPGMPPQAIAWKCTAGLRALIFIGRLEAPRAASLKAIALTTGVSVSVAEELETLVMLTASMPSALAVTIGGVSNAGEKVI